MRWRRFTPMTRAPPSKPFARSAVAGRRRNTRGDRSPHDRLCLTKNCSHHLTFGAAVRLRVLVAGNGSPSNVVIQYVLTHTQRQNVRLASASSRSREKNGSNEPF